MYELVESTEKGTPSLELGGGITTHATYESGTGTSELVFKYLVQPGDYSWNIYSEKLNFEWIDSFNLNGGTLTDKFGNDANIELMNPNSVGSLKSGSEIIRSCGVEIRIERGYVASMIWIT